MAQGKARNRAKKQLPGLYETAYVEPSYGGLVFMKKNLLLLMGGKSGEHEVSLVSGSSVFGALDKNKYEVTVVGIDKMGRWVIVPESWIPQHVAKAREMDLSKLQETVTVLPYKDDKSLRWLRENKALKIDVVLPILHGTNGEDGNLQGLLELADIPFVGSSVLGSAAGMDKDVTKKLCQAMGIPVVPWRVLRKSKDEANLTSCLREIEHDFGYPYFVKPANMGSSVGVAKIKESSEAKSKIHEAWQYDSKILIEKFVPARELEVSVLGNENAKASIVGEIIPTHDFYSYEAKYLDENGAHLKIPAEKLSPAQIGQIQEFAVQTFHALECAGLARVDFFLDKATEKIYLNEINTLPGFTNISMYPKLWAASGLGYPQLLDQLIELAFERQNIKNNLKTSFEGAKI